MTNPIPWTTPDILEATRGNLLCGEKKRSFSGISIDSRKISDNDLFVAIEGQVFDGHSFIEEVIGKGGYGIVGNINKTDEMPFSEWRRKGVVFVGVKDTTRALGDLAAFQRNRSTASVIAITGSNGKTTTREMTTAVISGHFDTLSTSGNLNNEIGLPLTLLKLSPSHQWAVLELGMNQPGEIGRLAEICRPDIGIITNIGPGHLEGVGSIDGVMRAKGELLEKIKETGTAILNADDPNIIQLSEKTSRNVLLFGMSKMAAIRALSVEINRLGTSFTLSLPGNSVSINLGIPGYFMVSNALAAASVGYILGLSAQEIKTGLENFKPVKGRMNVIQTKRGIYIIDDTYNANPASMEAAIMTLKLLKGKKKAFLVAGDMYELGQYAEKMHKTIGSLSAKSDLSGIYITGKFAETVASAARNEGMSDNEIFTGTKNEILEHMKNQVGIDDWVLVKGSRVMAMEKIVEGIKNWDKDQILAATNKE